MLPDVHEHKRTNVAIIRVCSFIKRTNTNELLAKRFTNCTLHIRFVCSPKSYLTIFKYSTNT
ncbi:hypothetical protein Hanom_Chr13g01225771 [Helianthus anomalus]